MHRQCQRQLRDCDADATATHCSCTRPHMAMRRCGRARQDVHAEHAPCAVNSVPVEKADEKVGAMIEALENTHFEDHALRWRVDSGVNTLWHEFPLPRQPNIEAISTQVRRVCAEGSMPAADASAQLR